MGLAELPDGRRVSAAYDFDRDWWTVRLEGDERPVGGRRLDSVVRDLLSREPAMVQRLAQHDTPAGPRVMCRCCGSLTLFEYGGYEICPVCDWEDDPTTIFAPGEPGGPGPNQVSLLEGRHAFTARAPAPPP